MACQATLHMCLQLTALLQLWHITAEHGPALTGGLSSHTQSRTQLLSRTLHQQRLHNNLGICLRWLPAGSTPRSFWW
jgi:hypothetical protein